MADINFNLKINEASKFNDVNSDGLGEFEGWGTSLCWWANRLGYNKNLINQAVDKFYSPNGLDLNIGRYNIGGGDHVKEVFHTPYYIDNSNKKVVYDLRTSGLKPEYFGTGMSISSHDMSTASYTRSDSDFGITSGSAVGTIESVNYINKLDSMTSFGGNLRYRDINVTNSGRYIVKFLLALEGENNRNIAIRVNDVSKYSIDKDTINNNAIATNGNRTIYLVEFDGVYLSQGVNTIDFGSNTTDWCLDVIKMAVVRSKEDDYYRDWYDVPPNKKADIYDCLDHRQSIKTGSAMGNFFLYDLYNATYSKSEANFGIQSGETIKNLYAFNNINKLDDIADTGGNATFKVDVKEEDDYDIILMLTLEGTNDRDMAIKVNGIKYSVGADVINNNIIASANNRKMYIATFYEIHLNRGVNTIIIGGNTGWGLDFVKMCVVKTTAYGVLPENDDFLHNAHINRSDSAIPGYCTDVCKINTNEHNIEWYHKNFERVDEECGYAWNYDWEADKYQMNIVKAIAKAKGSEFIAEAFSNSPPYFMTNSGCSSGATDSSQNNLRDNAYNAFAKYLADVIAHFNLRDNEVTFTSATGMNEPYTNYWGANSNKQEGCHFDQGNPQSRIIKALNWNLQDKGVTNCIVSGTDETSIDIAISSYNALDSDAKNAISRIDTHSYEGSDRAGLRQLAENEGKNLWMSEVDGDFTKGDNAGEMSAPLGLAHRIIEDLMWMKPSAWILWDIVDMHCDTGNVHDGNDFNWLNQNGGYWGLTACNHDDEYIWCLKKYYAFGQFTRYIRPGHNIFPIDWNAIGSYDSKNNKVVIVAINTESSDKSAWFSFEQFGLMDTNNITAIRTSGSLNGGENWADVSNSCNIWIEKDSKWFTATLKANSITTFIVDDVYLIKPSDLSTEITVYKGLNMLTPTGVTPEVGEYKVNILDTANCTAKLEPDNKTITVTSITSNEASIKVSINIENAKTYEKSISVAKIISTETIQKTVTRQSKLEQSLSGFKTTVSETYQSKSDMGAYSKTEQVSSMLEQTSKEITATFNNGYKRGITQMNAEGIKVYHNAINGENYTHMSPTGFYIKNKGEDIFKVDNNGLYVKGNGDFTGKVTANDGSIGGFTINSGKLVGTGGNGVGMSGNGADWAFWAGASTGGNAPFHVGHEGNLYATQANISGTITGSTISGGTIKGTEVIGGSLNVEGVLTANRIVCEDIDSPKYPGAITEDLWLYVSTSGNDDSELESGATFQTFDGLLDKLPKNLNGHEVHIELSTDITENVKFKGFHGGKIGIYMKGHTLYGYVVSEMGSARINICSGYIGNATDSSNGWGKIHPSKGYAVGNYTATVSCADSGAIGLYNIDIYGADKYLSGSSTKLGIASQDFGAVYLNGISYYGCDIGARANVGGRIHDAVSYNVCTKYGFYATSGGYITLAGNSHAGGKTDNYKESDGGKVIVGDGATFVVGNVSVPGSSAPVVTAKTVTVKSTSGDTYRGSVYNNWKKDNTVRQGDYGYGDCNGIWLFGDQFEQFKGKDITKVVITISRQDGGQYASVDLNIKTHNYKSRPSGKPSYVGTVGTLGLAVNSSGRKTITDTNNAIIAGLKAGTIKGIGLQTTYDSAHYAVCSGSVTIKVTYSE